MGKVRVVHIAVVIVLCGVQAAAQDVGSATAACYGRTQAYGTPQQLWGTLQPADLGALPPERDSTDYTGSQVTDWRFPLWNSLDVENGWVFTSYSFGFQVWDARPPNQGNPALTATRDQGRGEFLENIGYQEQRWLIWDIDAPPGRDRLVAMVGVRPFGMAIWDTADKRAPRILYQDTGPGANQVYATTIGGRDYAFSAADRGNSDGVHVYDMTRALESSSGGAGCIESSIQGGAACGGVYRGRIGGADPVSYIDGFQTATGRHILVFSSAALGPRGVALSDVSNPAAPLDLVPGGGRLFANEVVFGVAAWEQSGRQYLVLRASTGSRIHDLTSCVASGSCTSPPLVWSAPLPGVGKQLVTYSQSGGVGYLYFGDENGCPSGLQREWLYELSGLATTGPMELTPPWTMSIDSAAGGTTDVGYWGWYYPGNTGSVPGSSLDSGYSKVSPRTGKFHGDYFYRVAWTLFDVHTKAGALPSTLFSDGFETGDVSGWISSSP